VFRGSAAGKKADDRDQQQACIEPLGAVSLVRMDLSALLLSRLQFAFTVSFDIIFPSFTIGLAAWLTVLEALHLQTGRPAHPLAFEYWLKIFGVAFGRGVVSGIVMAFQFGMARMSGPIQGPLLAGRTITDRAD
jgi:cytochrome bd ubiquinol oxidase subunit I